MVVVEAQQQELQMGKIEPADSPEKTYLSCDTHPNQPNSHLRVAKQATPKRVTRLQPP